LLLIEQGLTSHSTRYLAVKEKSWAWSA